MTKKKFSTAWIRNHFSLPVSKETEVLHFWPKKRKAKLIEKLQLKQNNACQSPLD